MMAFSPCANWCESFAKFAIVTETTLKELFRSSNNVEWKQTIIRRQPNRIEMECHFLTNDGVVSVITDAFPNRDFLCEVIQTHCFAICEYSAEERGWIENNRFELRINDDDEPFEAISGTYMRWGSLVGNEDR